MKKSHINSSAVNLAMINSLCFFLSSVILCMTNAIIQLRAHFPKNLKFIYGFLLHIYSFSSVIFFYRTIHCGRTKSSTERCTNNQSTWHRHVLCIQFRWMCINCKKKTNVLFETNKQKTTNNWKRKKKLTKTPQSAVRHQSPRYHQLFISFFVCVYDSNFFFCARTASNLSRCCFSVRFGRVFFAV